MYKELIKPLLLEIYNLIKKIPFENFECSPQIITLNLDKYSIVLKHKDYSKGLFISSINNLEENISLKILENWNISYFLYMGIYRYDGMNLKDLRNGKIIERNIMYDYICNNVLKKIIDEIYDLFI